MAKTGSTSKDKAAPAQPVRAATSRETAWRWVTFGLCLVIVVLAVTNAVTYSMLGERIGATRSAANHLPVAPSFQPLRDFAVVNAHDHLYSRKYLPKYFEAAKRTGIVSTLFVASSEYTLHGRGGDPKKGNEANSREMIEAAREYPGKIIPFGTFHPSDPEKMDKLKQFVADGAAGLKLYSGHSNFYDRPLDVEEMMPVYAYCAETGFPICWHVNLLRYAAEFERVLSRFPNLKLIVPHFGVTFFRPKEQPWREFQRMLDTYPNLYTDTSFGTREILVSGLESVNRHPEIFRAFLEKYSDRVLFGTDMVVTGNKEKTEEWIEAVIRACRDVLEKETFHFFMGAKGSKYAAKGANNTYGIYRGLALSDDILRKIYETNIRKVIPSW